MKQLLKNLAIGLAIAVVAAVAICFAAWSFHSMHRFIWFVVCSVAFLFIGQYLINPDYVLIEKDGKKYKERISKTKQIGAVAGILVALGIVCSLAWAIGYGVAALFDWHPDFWEMYLLYGALTVAAVILAFVAGFRFWYYCDDFYYNRYGVRDSAKEVAMWIFIALCGLAVAGTILYYLFPWALRH